MRDALEEARRTLNHLHVITADDATEPDRSMRGCTRCPSCGSGQLLFAAEVLDRAEGFFREAMALHQPSKWRFKGAGKFQAWICTGCGLTEWYVATLTDVFLDSKRHRERGVATPVVVEPPVGAPPEEARQCLRWLHEAETRLRRSAAALMAERINGNGVLNRSMRHRRCCPRCRCRDLLHAAEVLDRADGMVRAAMSISQPRWHKTDGAGVFQAWVCTGCGLTEWYVPQLDGVDTDSSLIEVHQWQQPRAAPRALPPAAPVSVADEARSADRDLARGLAAVGENVTTLQELLSALLAVATATPAPLRRLQCCPACGHGEVLHAAMVLDRSEVGRNRMTLVQPWVLGMDGAGPMEVWVCTGCGLVEWAVTDLTGVKPDGKKLRLVQRDDGGASPYR